MSTYSDGFLMLKFCTVREMHEVLLHIDLQMESERERVDLKVMSN